MRELCPSERSFDATRSGYESGWPSNVTWCATATTGSGHVSSTVARRGAVVGGSAGMSRGIGRSAAGIRPKYFVTSSAACALSKSPAMASVAFDGT